METENISTNEEGLSSGSVDVEPPAITSAFQVDRNQIESIALENQPEELRALGIVAYDQSTFEEGILQQVDDALEKQNKLKKQNVAQPKKKVRKETEKQKLIRLGQITPFGTAVSGGGTNVSTSLERYLQEQERLKEQKKQENGKGKALKRTSSFTSPTVITTNSLTSQSKEARKNKKSSTSTSRKRNSSDDEYIPEKSETKSSKKRKISTSSFGSKDLDLEDDDGDVTYYQTDDSDWESESEVGPASSKRKKKSGRVIDDGNVNDYQERLAKWKATCGPREEIPCHELEGGYRIPLSVWDSLYNYQKVGVQWMWELRLQRCGGILGDEMGLGKTIQAVAFLAGLSHCRIITRQSSYSGLGPVLLVAPTTVMHQWTKEFHKWWPPFRVAILHESGSHSGSRQSLIRSINAANGVLITSYTGVVSNSESLLGLDWDYIILDEGHKIRNPDAQATLVLKQFRTSNRFILSGSPMQNNLKELWSLVDFVFPGKLGTLPVFIQQFSVPITQGGYSNASQVQVATAYKCATVLKRTIEPYLLRRMKADVKDHLSLPDKNEQVLFCRLTSEQREMYQSYLDSGEIKNIVDGRLQIFVGLTKLRKICNHPDLFDKKQAEHSDKSCVERSGKMVVVESLLRIWKDQQHRCLLFSQSKKMLDMLETFVREQNYSYLRMDGTTSIGSRHPMVEKFNQSEDIFVFLLTTRVGGLGVNLTGANRVIIYDPDWNPSTDTQARERSWRIGQKKDVTIYRLLTSGTIEEKIYHRQIFKQYLTNRVLNDPKQRRFFKSNDLYELFTLKETDSQCTETEAIFAGTSSDVSTTNPYGGESGRGGDRKQLAKSTDDEWMRQWKKEKEKREAEWKKKVEKEKRKAELKALNETEEEKRIRKKRESKERKEKRQVKVDGGRVKNAIKVTSYRPSEADTAADETSVDSSSSSQQNNDYVLKSLFAKTGVMSALQHDRIIDAGNPDYALIEGEAERVAQQAIRELKSSRRRECWTAADGVPTWTGTSGGVRPLSGNKPRFGAKKRNPIAHSTSSENTTVTAGQVEPSSNQSSAPSAAPSSSDLLNRMAARNRLLGVPGSAPPPDDDDESYLGQAREEENLIHQSTPVPLEFATGVDYRSMMDEVRSFVAFRGVVPGQVSTSDLLNEFNGNLPSRGAPLFRALLKQLCNFTRNVHGDGIWQLKPEFQ